MIVGLVPAAGASRRMGRPKLTLPVRGGGTVLGRVIEALRDGGSDRVLVVAPPATAAHAASLIATARAAGAEVLHCPAPTPDMRATIEYGLRYVETFERPPLGLVIAPGDAVGMSRQAVSAVVTRFRGDPGKLVVPTRGDAGGHPIALPWPIAQTIPTLPEGVGINALKERHADIIERVELDSEADFGDLDTPEDYERWRPGPGG